MTDKDKLKYYEQSPFVSSYEATYSTIERFNEQLKHNEIDIFNINDKPRFEMAHKYLTELDGYLTTLEKIRERMSPEEKKAVDAANKNHKKSETTSF